jgi:hypothetical protein
VRGVATETVAELLQQCCPSATTSAEKYRNA